VHQLGDALGAVDLERPLGDGAEERAVVDLLEGLAAAQLAVDLADRCAPPGWRWWRPARA